MKILIIDDQEFIHDIFDTIFENEKLDHAINANEALDMIKSNGCYKHIFLDLKMEDGNGAEFITKYKGNIPVTIVSSCEKHTVKCAETIAKKIGINITTSIKKPITHESVTKALLESRETRSNRVIIEKSQNDNRISEEEFTHYVSNGYLRPYFQAQYCLKDAKVIGAEMLCRICLPGSEILSPNVFIHHMERPEHYNVSITLFNDAINLWKQHPDTKDLSLSVNVFPSMLRNCDFVKALIQLKLASKNTKVIIEITETIGLSIDDLILANMLSLKMAGYHISIDDFGNQHSNFYRMSNFTIDELKIDASYIQDIMTNDTSRSIVRSIIKMTEELKIDCVAEGIESLEQLSLIRSLGTIKIQGYYLSKPSSFDALADSLLNIKHESLSLDLAVTECWAVLEQVRVNLESSPLANVTSNQQKQKQLFIILAKSIHNELMNLLEISDTNNHNKVPSIAHKIKGTARMGGVSQVIRIAEHLEEAPEEILNPQMIETIKFYADQILHPLSVIQRG